MYSKVSLSRTLLIDPADAAEGGVWQDPPEYFDQIVWPAYIKAHEDVANVDRMTVVNPDDGDLTNAFEVTCEAIDAFLKS
jgi:nicotinamide/nicotinate riboside kinase